jgi:hypothetical protein
MKNKLMIGLITVTVIIMIMALSACIKVIEAESLLSVNYDDIFINGNETRLIEFQAIDDMSSVMNYTLYADGIEISSGDYLNNSIFNEPFMFITENKTQINISLIVTDQAGNSAYAYTIIGFDSFGPQIIYIKVK